MRTAVQDVSVRGCGRLPGVVSDLHEMLTQLRAAPARERHQMLWKFPDQSDTRDTLRAVRRHGPGRLRLAALDALMYLGGEAALDAVDVAAAERLIRIRRLTDPVGPVMSCWTYWWCIRGGDQAGIMATLGLTDSRPVTYNLACTVVDLIEHMDEPPGLVYVGPEINGWTPVVGDWCDAFGDRAFEVRTTIEQLSVEYGEAHAFYFGAQGDGSAWLVAQDGVTTRRYSSVDPEESTGEPLPIERDWMLARGVPGRPEDHVADDDEFADAMWEFCEANDVAAAISVDIGWHRPLDAVVHGYPVLAAVPEAAPITLPPGVYEI